MAFNWINLLVPAIAAALAVGACYLFVNYTEFGARQAERYDDLRKVYALVGVIAAVTAYFFAPTGTTSKVTNAAAYVNPFLEDDKGHETFGAGATTDFGRGAQAQARAQAMADGAGGQETGDGSYQEPVLDEPFED